MAVEIRISMEGDPAAALEKAWKPMMDGSARAMANTLVRHFRAKNRTPNAKGFRRSNFWSQAAESVTSRAEGMSAVAEVRKEGVLLHWKGGTVRPKDGHKALAIPEDPSVAGIWPSEYAGKVGTVTTFLLWREGENRGFIGTPDKSAPNGVKVLWWLVSKAHHISDPTAMPDTETLATAVARACRAVLKGLEGGAA